VAGGSRAHRKLGLGREFVWWYYWDCLGKQLSKKCDFYALALRTTILVAKNWHQDGLMDCLGAEGVKCTGVGWKFSSGFNTPTAHQLTLSHIGNSCRPRTMQQSSIAPERCWLIVQWIPAVTRHFCLDSAATAQCGTVLTEPSRNIRTYLHVYTLQDNLRYDFLAFHCKILHQKWLLF